MAGQGDNINHGPVISTNCRWSKMRIIVGGALDCVGPHPQAPRDPQSPDGHPSVQPDCVHVQMLHAQKFTGQRCTKRVVRARAMIHFYFMYSTTNEAINKNVGLNDGIMIK